MPTTTQTKHRHAANGVPFEDDLRTVVQGVRGALAEVVAGIEVDATRPQQMARDVGLDKSLSWKLSRILSEDDACATAVHLPGKAGLRIVLKSFEKAGASESSLESLRHAVAEFDRMVETHCGDRETLEMMVGHLRGDGNGHQHEEAQRKKSFQGNSAIWGVQARVHLAAHFMRPNANDGDMIDFATIAGLVELRRLRSDVPWAVASIRQYNDDGTTRPIEHFEPLDQTIPRNEVPLLKEFSSATLPPLRKAPGQPGITRYELTNGPVGNTGTITCFTAWMSRKVATRFRTPEDTYGEHLVNINTPAELLVFDLYVHHGLGFDDPKILLYSQLPGGPLYPSAGRDVGLLPLRESLIHLGESRPNVILPEVPRYHAIADMAMRRLGGTPDDYKGYRLRMRYPAIPTLAVYRHMLPEPTRR